MGFSEGLNRVCLGRVMVEGSTPGMEIVAWYSMMDKMFSGFLEEAIIVFTPASVAISAAISFVSIPPVPRLDPSVAVLTYFASCRAESVVGVVVYRVDKWAEFFLTGGMGENRTEEHIKWMVSLMVSCACLNLRGNEWKRKNKKKQTGWRTKHVRWNEHPK